MKAAVIGGVTWGVLTSIPGVNFLNFFCCAWIVMGGALAAYVYVGKSPRPVLRAEGAQLGAMAGVIGTLVAWAIGIPLSLVLSGTTNRLLVSLMERLDPQQGEQLRRILEQAQSMPLSQRLPSIIISALVGAVVYIAFSTLGGLLGVSMFEKRKPDTGAPPPTPTAFNAGPPPA